MSAITIAGRQIGPGQPCYVVAEASCNHLGFYERATRLIEVAKEAGAEAIKFQYYGPSDMCLPGTKATWHGVPLWTLYAQARFPKDWCLGDLKAYADYVGITLFCSVFNPDDVPYLEGCGMPAYKIASAELGDLPLIRACAKTGKPLILSTGMASQTELYEALNYVHIETGLPHAEVALLKCTSAYPASSADANLITIRRMAIQFNCPVGLSDHTLGIAVPVAAVAMGASIIEKHLTLSRADGGPDAAFSLEPAEFKQMVEAVRVAEAALGEVRYGPTDSEREMLKLRRSLWVVADIAKGEAFTSENVRSLRPADGLPPKHLEEVLGKLAARDIAAGTALEWGMVQL